MMVRMPPRIVFAWLLSCAFLFVPAIAATKKPPAHPVDINSASSAQLQLVPGIGPATAEKILAMRKSYGAFKNVDDLLSVRGIGPKRLEKMRKYLVAGHAVPGRRVGGSAATAPAKPAACGNCSRGAPAASASSISNGKKATAIASKTNSKPGSGGGDAADSEEEPE